VTSHSRGDLGRSDGRACTPFWRGWFCCTSFALLPIFARVCRRFDSNKMRLRVDAHTHTLRGDLDGLYRKALLKADGHIKDTSTKATELDFIAVAWLLLEMGCFMFHQSQPIVALQRVLAANALSIDS